MTDLIDRHTDNRAMSLDVRKETRQSTPPADEAAERSGRIYTGKVKGFTRGKPLRQLLIGLALVLATAWATWLLVAPDAAKPLSVTLNQVGPDVGQTEPVTGTVQSLSAGDAVYVFVQAAGDTHFYPQRGPCVIASGQFTCDRVQFGPIGAAGKKAYEVVVILANGTAQQSIIDYQRALTKNPKIPGLTAIPAGAREMARQSVNRVR